MNDSEIQKRLDQNLIREMTDEARDLLLTKKGYVRKRIRKKLNNIHFLSKELTILTPVRDRKGEKDLVESIIKVMRFKTSPQWFEFVNIKLERKLDFEFICNLACQPSKATEREVLIDNILE